MFIGDKHVFILNVEDSKGIITPRKYGKIRNNIFFRSLAS